jgi:hypothetical protein
VGADTKAMVKVMKETLDKVEKELITLKAENKSLILKHTLLTTEHTVMKARYSSQGNESGDPLAQCQKDLADWQNRYLAKDKESKMLSTQLDVLTNVIQTQGLVHGSGSRASPCWSRDSPVIPIIIIDTRGNVHGSHCTCWRWCQ